MKGLFGYICSDASSPVAVAALALAALTLLVAVLALCAARAIPKKIMINQRFMSLTEQYRSPEMGFAVYCIFKFYKEDCGDNPDRIEEKYVARFRKEIEEPMKKGAGGVDPSKTLHFQKRLVAYYFWDLARLYFESRFPASLGKKRLLQMVEPSERKLISLVLQMGEASEKCFAKCENIADPPDSDVPMNQSLKRLYDKTGEMM